MRILTLFCSYEAPPWIEFHQIKCKTAQQHFFLFVSFLQRIRVYWPLDTVGESRTVVWGGGVVSAYSIQEVVVCRHTHSSTPLGHGSTHAPLVGVRIEAFHGPQTWAAVPTTYCKQSEKINKTGSKSQMIYTVYIQYCCRNNSYQLSDVC